MKIGKIVIAAVLAGLAMWIIAGIWHDLILPKMTPNHHAHEGIGVILIAYLILGGFMAGIFSRLKPAPFHPLLAGALFGAVIGLLWVFPHELALAGAQGSALAYVFKNGAWHGVEQAFGGVVIGLILRQP